MAISYLTGETLSDELVRRIVQDDLSLAWPCGSVTNTTMLVDALASERMKTVKRVFDAGTLLAALDNGHPVIAPVYAQNTETNQIDLVGKIGHFMLVVGATPTEIVANDPGRSARSNGEYRHFPLRDFVNAWWGDGKFVGIEVTGPLDATSVCGDGQAQGSEGCDDGNTVAGDGCGANCQVEGGWSCNIAFSPSRCSSAMVHVPAGPFMMGDTGTVNSDEQPVHQVTLSAYSLDAHEVTNAEYLRCEAAGGCTAPSNPDSRTRTAYHTAPAYAAYPVILVTWTQARAYCAWAGKRLPTEAEWEKAARGGCEVIPPATCGAEDRREYPWGDAVPSCALANYFAGPACTAGSGGDTDMVGRRLPGDSPYGAHDLAGNVYEWVADFYAPNLGYSQCAGGCTDPQGPSSGTSRVYRGGSFATDAVTLRVAGRNDTAPDDSRSILGFRCAGTF